MKNIILIIVFMLSLFATSFAQKYGMNGWKCNIEKAWEQTVILDSANTSSSSRDSLYLSAVEPDNWACDSVAFWIEVITDTLASGNRWVSCGTDYDSARVEVKAQFLSPNHIPFATTWAGYTSIGTHLPATIVGVTAVAATIGRTPSKFYVNYKFLVVNTRLTKQLRLTYRLYTLKYWS